MGQRQVLGAGDVAVAKGRDRQHVDDGDRRIGESLAKLGVAVRSVVTVEIANGLSSRFIAAAGVSVVCAVIFGWVVFGLRGNIFRRTGGEVYLDAELAEKEKVDAPSPSQAAE